MSPSPLRTLVACLPALLAATAQAATLPTPTAAEAELRAINHRYVNAFAVGDGEYMEALTAADFLLIGTTGDWIERARHLELMAKSTVAGGVAYDDVRVRLFGSVALVHGLFEANGASGEARRVRYTDVYHWDGARWQLVNAQNTALREGVSKHQERGQAPASAKWAGQDPTGDDLEVLRELNASYVQAFRAADVAWYDAHLAPDYVVVNSDGSFHDRAEALTEFAKTTYQTHMQSFPVDQVRIRRFDDVALIHAENAYQLKDGRKGVNRYTDIWQKQPDGRWLCLAAHITTYKSPG